MDTRKRVNVEVRDPHMGSKSSICPFYKSSSKTRFDIRVDVRIDAEK